MNLSEHVKKLEPALLLNISERFIRNAIQCKICGDIIESISVHDFKTCSCGSCSVDGGHDYLRRCAKSLDDFVDLSEFQRDPNEEK